MTDKHLVTILLPAYNEEASMSRLEASMLEIASANDGYEWEFLMVNDGSRDNTLKYMQELHKRDSRFAYIDLSRNYGKEVAMLAGFDYARGDAVIVMDADMQHPINVIPEMLKYWQEGYDDVYARRRSSNEGFFKKISSKAYYRVLQRFTHLHIQKDAGDFRLLDRTCVNALCHLRERERNTKALYSWIGFHKKEVQYDQLNRMEGSSKWSIMALVNLALTGITSYTTAPLRFATILGGLFSLAAFAYAAFTIVKTIIWGDPVAGYPTLVTIMLLLGGVQLLSLGIIGEYLGRVFNESKSRPVYFINSYNGSRPNYERTVVSSS